MRPSVRLKTTNVTDIGVAGGNDSEVGQARPDAIHRITSMARCVRHSLTYTAHFADHDERVTSCHCLLASSVDRHEHDRVEPT